MFGTTLAVSLRWTHSLNPCAFLKTSPFPPHILQVQRLPTGSLTGLSFLWHPVTSLIMTMPFIKRFLCFQLVFVSQLEPLMPFSYDLERWIIATGAVYFVWIWTCTYLGVLALCLSGAYWKLTSGFKRPDPKTLAITLNCHWRNYDKVRWCIYQHTLL